MKNSIRIVPKGEIALVEWDLEGEKANKLSTPMMNRFVEVMAELKNSSFKAVIMISRKNSIFIAGADIAEIQNIREKKDAYDKAAGGQKIISEIEALPMPVIAAIHGACLGGGCEMILACDYRLATDDRATKIGLPETQLGIIPGFGGCVRLPRVIGIPAALDIILAGKSVDGRKAEKLGLVDRCVPAAILEEEAFKMAKDIIAKGAQKRKKYFAAKDMMTKFMHTPMGRPIVFSQAKKMLLAKTRGNYPAPLKAIEVIKNSYGKNLPKALQIEADGFSEVAITDISKNLINLFYLTEGIKKQNGVENPAVKARSIKALGVLGAGTMGGGIAQLAADKHIEARVKDINYEALSKAFVAAQSIWEKALKTKKMNRFEFQQKMDLISGSTSFSGFGRLDLVIEAIVEDMEIKKKVIGETAKHCKPDAIIATNTSSLSVTEMSAGHPRPENFVGMHFFNPVHKMPLVEVIRGEKTSDEVTATIFELSKKMGKFPVVVKDGPGFLVNRLLLPYLNEAVYMLSEGVSVEEIDEHYLNFGMPMGPLHLIDEIGIDVAVKVAKIFHKAFGSRAEPSPLMAKVVETGRLGKKNGKGFYHYDERGKKLEVDQGIYSALGLSRPSAKISAETCVERGMFAMINEAALSLLEDKIVSSADGVDLAMIMGTGFPPFRGGLLRYADSVGSSKVVEKLQQFSEQNGARFKPSLPLKEMAKSNKTFY